VRVLLDEQLPRRLAHELVGHEVSTVQQEGWAGLENGELLRVAEERGFEVFLTKDTNLEFQLNLRGVGMGIVVLDAPSHDIAVLRPMLPDALEAIHAVAPGEIRHVAV
jgi:predicted nuclease of predicted toxin-antitoxin system